MATPNYIQDPKKKKGIADPNQVNNAAAGSDGALTRDSSGTGANTPDRLNTAVRGVVSSLGVNPDVQNLPVSNILKNTAQNIASKGIIGSFAEGAKRSIGELATQSTNFGKAYLEGGKNVLFGKGGETSTTASTPIATTSTDTTRTGSNVPSSTSPIGPVIPSSSSVEGVKIGQTPQGQLSISDQAGGTGTIQFKDQRKLGQESLDRLAGVVRQNADLAFQKRLADEAALSQSRYDALNTQKEESNKANELDYFKRAHLDALRRNDLVSVSQFANRIKELEGAGLARELAGSKAAQESDIASRRIGFDVSKTRTQQALEAGKQQDQLRTDFFKMLSDSEKSGTSNPLTNYSAARSAFGDNIDRRVLHAALGNDVASSLIENRGNLEEQVPILQRLGFPEQDAQYILNQINQ